MKLLLPHVIGCACLFGTDLPAAAPPASLRLVSAGQIPVHSGSGHSSMPVFSGDGRSIVFVSQANNLVTNDNLAPWLDVYVRDLAASNMVLVSVNLGGTGGGDADANSPSISSNGQWVTFAGAASNLVPGDNNGASDVFVRDLVSGETRLVSVDVNGQSPSNVVMSRNLALSGNPLMSGDGARIVFESHATNLVLLPDGNGGSDIFLRDWQVGITRLVSANMAGMTTGNGPSHSPSISAEADVVTFVSTATDLTPGLSTSLGDIYVRDTRSNVTVWASTNLPLLLGAAPGSYRCFDPVVSASGRCVAFKTMVSGLSEVRLFHHDLQNGMTVQVATNCQFESPLQLSADGRYLTYGSSFTFWSDPSQGYRWDALTQNNLLVSVRADGLEGGNGSSRLPAMSADGQTVAFTSWASDLIEGVSNAVSQVFVRDIAAGTTRLVSVATNGLPSGQIHDAHAPVLSPDGQQVAFESMAHDLAAGDLNQASDIYLYEIGQTRASLVSARHETRPPLTGVGNAGTRSSAVSSNGLRVLLHSTDSSFVSGDTNSYRDIFVRDLASGAVLPVTVGIEGLDPTNQISSDAVLSRNGRFAVFSVIGSEFRQTGRRQSSYRRDLHSNLVETVYSRQFPALSASPTVSADGSWVTFESNESGLVNYVSGTPGIEAYVRNMEAGTNQLVSITYWGDYVGEISSLNPVISPDGRWVAFKSGSTDIVYPRTSGLRLYVRDLLLQTSLAVAGGQDFSKYVFSEDSRWLACVQSGTNVLVHDLIGQTNVFTTNNCADPSLSADGRWLVFESPATGSVRQVFARDLQTGLTELISVNQTASGGGNGLSGSASISPNARFVVFASKASDLVAGDTNGFQDVFLRDRGTGQTLLLSQNLAGTGSGNSASGNPVLSADGSTVVFESYANDLVDGDYNDRQDVFVLRLNAGDSDSDGLPDDWEMAFFDTLARDGMADFDGDGHTDYQEYQAGTDPTNRGSVLTVLTLQGAGSGAVTVLWSAVPGRTYRVQFKDMVSGQWTDLPGSSVATGSTGSKVDDSAGVTRQRFYRVMVED